MGAKILIMESENITYFLESRSCIHHLSLFILNEMEWLMVLNIIYMYVISLARIAIYPTKVVVDGCIIFITFF